MSPDIKDIIKYAKWGYSAADIGFALGCTRNAVLGKCHCQGVSLSALNGNGQYNRRTQKATAA